MEMGERSLPSRGAWVEIRTAELCFVLLRSLPSRGAWVEIWLGYWLGNWVLGRSPRGERGLKFASPQAREHL